MDELTETQNILIYIYDLDIGYGHSVWLAGVHQITGQLFLCQILSLIFIVGIRDLY